MVKYETSAKKYVSPDLLVSLYQQGLSERQISNRLREDKVYLSKAGVHKRLVKLRLRFPELKRIADQKKQKIFSQVRPALMKFLICCRNCRSTKRLCDALGKKGKERTLRRYLKSLRDPRLVRPRKQPRIDKRQMRRRLAFARSFLEKSFDWRTAYFGDEKMFSLDGPGYRTKLLAYREEKVPALPRRGRHQHGVFVFGCFSASRAPPLVVLGLNANSDDYCWALKHTLPRHAVYFHDLWSVHTSALTAEFCQKNKIFVHRLPPCACDLNPVEHLWALVSARVYPNNKTYEDTGSLVAAVKAAWATVTMDATLRTALVDSMPQRLEAVLRNRGAFCKL